MARLQFDWKKEKSDPRFEDQWNCLTAGNGFVRAINKYEFQSFAGGKFIGQYCSLQTAKVNVEKILLR